MSELEKTTPAGVHRLWDKDCNCIGSWPGTPPAAEMVAGRLLTIDFPIGQRWSGVIVDGVAVSDLDLAKTTTWTWPSNLCFEEGTAE